MYLKNNNIHPGHIYFDLTNIMLLHYMKPVWRGLCRDAVSFIEEVLNSCEIHIATFI